MSSLLQSPIRIGSIELKNRVVMPPIATYQSTEDGKVTEKMLSYYGLRAENGQIGLIVTEHSYITQQGKAMPRQMSVACDEDIDGLRQLTAAIHRQGTKTFAQLNHAGSVARPEVTGLPSMAPSAPPAGQSEENSPSPEVLDAAGIAGLVAAFAAAAVRAKAAGYDGVEIHSAHGYLLNQFYSPLTNRRSDEYGGSLQGRMRFLLQTVAAVRAAVGETFPISVRLGGCDYMEGGSTIADSVEAAVLLEKAGVDLLSVTGGMCRYTRADHDEPGYFRDMSSEIKRNVRIPVLLTGGVKTPEQAELLLAEQAADLIGVGRAILKNPNWPAV